MRQGDVFSNPYPRMARAWPYVVVLQDNRFVDIDSVVVAPCASASRGSAYPRLTPTIEIDGAAFYVLIPAMSAMPRRVLGAQPIANAAGARDDILAALDFLFTGI